MTKHLPFRRLGLAAAVAGLALLLSACLISPGKFTSTIDLRRNGTFAYSYTGEIYLLGLGKLAELGAKSKASATFEPVPCYKDDDSGDERPCTKDELTAQRESWDAEQKDAAEKAKKDAEMMRALLGGIDPANPKAAEELADRLRRQVGWKAVTYKGDGMYVVDFQITGRLDHDFTFPTIERFPMATSFVDLNKRADGAVRMDAPAFAAGSNNGGMSSFAQLAAMGAAMDGKGEDMPKFPELDGTLTLTTDGQILANNTDEGPVAVPGGQKLEWKISPRTTAAPTALVKLGG